MVALLLSHTRHHYRCRYHMVSVCNSWHAQTKKETLGQALLTPSPVFSLFVWLCSAQVLGYTADAAIKHCCCMAYPAPACPRVHVQELHLQVYMQHKWPWVCPVRGFEFHVHLQSFVCVCFSWKKHVYSILASHVHTGHVRMYIHVHVYV